MKSSSDSWFIPTITIVAAAILALSPTANAALVNNGGGLIYDTDLNITWYEDATSSMAYSQAANWAAELTVGGTVAGSWRLPWIADGQDWGFDHVGEMGHLFYAELGNPEGGPLLNTGPFLKLQPTYYWSSTSWWRNRNLLCYFSFADGVNRAAWPWDSLNVLAVHEGNVRPPCLGDLNFDGHIDLTDLSVLLSNFGAPGTFESGDLNRDGTVDLSDLSMLLSVFGADC